MSVNPDYPGTHKCADCGEWMYLNDTAKAIDGTLVCESDSKPVGYHRPVPVSNRIIEVVGDGSATAQ